jgi:orotidine-5'-phosphate decarboxylase
VPRPFGERLAERVRERDSQLVLGLDPDPGALWPDALAAAPSGGTAAERAAAAVAAHCRLLIEAAGASCVAAKPQLACFERLGAAGWEALARTVETAHEHGLLVLADGKRGDVPVTAAAYAQALFGSTPTPFGDVEGLGVDAITVNPLLGEDAVAPLLEAARARGAGIFLLVRTSNPGAADVQDVEMAGGGPLWERLASMVDRLGEGAPVANVGAVTGATVPEHLVRLRELMPRAPFLLPGVGAQGGRVEDLAPAFAPGPGGGLVTASRSIARAGEASGEAPGPAAAAEAERLRDAAPRPAVNESDAPRGYHRRAMDHRTPLRFLAPIALIAIIVAIFLVIGSTTGGGSGSDKAGDGNGTQLTAQERKRRRERRKTRTSRTTYTVKAGDSLDAIAITVKVPKETLLQLNPDLDPQALQPGQKIKIR